MNVLITGYKQINNPIQIKDFLFELKQRFKDDRLLILNRGEYKLEDRLHIDLLVKKYCREFEIDMEEYTPPYKVITPFTTKLYNIYSKCKRNSYMRYNEMIKNCDIVIYFIDSSLYSDMSDIKDKSFFDLIKKINRTLKFKIIK